MTRTWMLRASPVAFAAGLLLVHCSSSSSTSAVDSGTDAHHSSTAPNHSSGSNSSVASSGSGNSSVISSSGNSSIITTSSSAASSVASSGTGTSSSAAPMTVPCGTTTCPLPTDICCESKTDAGIQATCMAAGSGSGSGACAGVAIACVAAADCTIGDICCLAVTGAAPLGGSMSCQAPGTGSGSGATVCPSSVADLVSGQICATSTECPAGSTCTPYNCEVTTIQACSGTLAGAFASACKAIVPPTDGGASSSASSASSASSSGSGSSGSTGSSGSGSSGSSGTGTSSSGASSSIPAGPTGMVECNGTDTCNVATDQCCVTTSESCTTQGTSCAGMAVTCTGSSNCTGGDVCCLAVTSAEGAGTMSCMDISADQECPQAGTGSILLGAQICETDADCDAYYSGGPGGCMEYSCAGGSTVYACSNPDPSDTICTLTPGQIDCGGMTCNVLDSNQCCETTTATCEDVSVDCSAGMAVTCEDASDCTDSKICCINVTSTSGTGTMSCQTGPTCPTGAGVLTGQNCSTGDECGTGGTCGEYVCNGTATLYFCEGSIEGAGASECVLQ